MSFEATVYLNLSKIEPQWLDDSVEVDKATGAVSSTTHHIPAKAREACSYRLGNQKYIERCRQEIERAVKGRAFGVPILLGKVLAEEAASGAVIPLKEVAGLKRELKSLEQVPKLSADVKELIFRLTRLVQAAEENRNPIVLS